MGANPAGSSLHLDDCFLGRGGAVALEPPGIFLITSQGSLTGTPPS